MYIKLGRMIDSASTIADEFQIFPMDNNPSNSKAIIQGVIDFYYYAYGWDRLVMEKLNDRYWKWGARYCYAVLLDKNDGPNVRERLMSEDIYRAFDMDGYQVTTY